MARRSSQDPSDPYREFWEHPGRSSKRSGRRSGARQADRGERPRRPQPRSGLRTDPRPDPRAGSRTEPRAPFDPRAPQDPRVRDRRPPLDPRGAPGRADEPRTGHDSRTGYGARTGFDARAGFGAGRGPRGQAGFGRRPDFDARTAFAQDDSRGRRSPVKARTKTRGTGKGRRGAGAPEISGYPRRSADGLTIGSVVVVFAVGLSTLAAVENSLLTGEFVGASGTRAAGGGASAKPRPTRSAPRPQRPAQPPVQTLNDRVNELTLQLRGPAARQSYGGDRPPLSGAIRFSGDRTWAFGTTAIPVPPDREAMPQVALYVAQWTGDRWRIALSGTEEFSQMLAKAPAQLMPADERRTLARFSSGTARAAQAAGLMLPWKVGQTWAMTARPLGGQAARPLGAVAFRGGDGRVLAAAAGRVYRFCATADGRGLVMVIHPDGLATTYYHLTGVLRVRDGSPVARGALLGRTGTDRPCGGAPVDRPQVQFGLRSGSEDLPFEGVPMGGWTFRERARPLIGWAERGLLQILPGGLLRNFGPGGPPDPTPEEEDPNGPPGLEGLDPPGQTGAGQEDKTPTQNQERNASGDPQQ